MDAVVRDVRQALRLVAGHRGFAAAALITIALGVGGTAAVFSVVYGVLLRPLPYPEPERLVRVWERHPGANAPLGEGLLTRPTYNAWFRATRSAQPSGSLQEIGAFQVGTYALTGLGAGQRLRGTAVTPSIFRVLRISPAAGRFFSEADVEPGAPPVVILTHATWRDRFGGDLAALGQTLTLDDVDRRIIGVAPPGFAFPGFASPRRDGSRPSGEDDITLFTPYAVATAESRDLAVGIVTAIARLRPAATIAQAEAEGTAYARSVGRGFANAIFGDGGAVEVRVRSIVELTTMRVRPALMVLAAGVGLVLLIACANVANLFLSRGTDRARELAVRAALGASRRRLVRQLLTESLVVSLIGGTLGLFVGWALTAAVPALAPPDFPRLDEIQVDGRFLAVAALAAIFVGTLSGVLPATRSSRVDLARSMQAGGARSVGAAGGRVRRLLLVLEAALAVVLLVGAALLARSFAALVQVDAGYTPANVLTANLSLPATGETASRVAQITASALERLRAMPGVRAAGAGSMAPFGGALFSSGFALPGLTMRDGRPVMARALHAVISPGYAEALGMRLKEGRLFRAEDSSPRIIALIVNETFAKTYFTDGRPATGRRFIGMFPRMLGKKDAVVDVVGVVEDVLPADLDAPPQPQIYVPYGVGFDTHLRNATFVVKTAGDPTAAAPLVRATVADVAQQVAPGSTLDRLGPLTAKVSDSVGQPRFATFVLVSFAALALGMATTGLYGVLSYNVAQRQREIGVRAALGATQGDLVRMVLREGLTVTVMGLAVGLMVAAFATRAMGSVLFGVTPLDRVAFSVAPLLLLIVAAAACLIPARRAAGIDPAKALRSE